MNEKIKLGEMFFEVNHNINYSTYYSLYKIFDEYYFVFGMLAKDFRENASLVTKYPKIDKLLNGRVRGNTQDRNCVDIDVLYFTRSSKKWCSTAFRQMAYNFGTKKYVWDKDIFTPLIMKFYDKWESLLTTLGLDYNPIHNYDMTEDEKVMILISIQMVSIVQQQVLLINPKIRLLLMEIGTIINVNLNEVETLVLQRHNKCLKPKLRYVNIIFLNKCSKM